MDLVLADPCVNHAGAMMVARVHRDNRDLCLLCSNNLGLAPSRLKEALTQRGNDKPRSLDSVLHRLLIDGFDVAEVSGRVENGLVLGVEESSDDLEDSCESSSVQYEMKTSNLRCIVSGMHAGMCSYKYYLCPLPTSPRASAIACHGSKFTKQFIVLLRACQCVVGK